MAGDAASLTDPALDSILDFAGEVGLVVILHSDIDMPFAKAGAELLLIIAGVISGLVGLGVIGLQAWIGDNPAKA